MYPPTHKSGASAVLLAALLLGGVARPQNQRALLSLIRDDTRAQALRRARTLLRQGHTAQGIEQLLECLTASPSAVVYRGSGLYLGLREAARHELSRLDARGVAIYERYVANRAGSLLRDARRGGDPAELGRVALRFPHTEAAHIARLDAGDRFFEQGRTLRALQAFDLLDPARLDPAVVARRQACRAMLGLPWSVAGLPSGTRLPFGERMLPLTEFAGRLRALAPSRRVASAWPSCGGPAGGSGLASEPVHPRSENWGAALEDFSELEDGESPFDLHPVADGRRVFVNTGTRLYCFDLVRGAARAWRSASYIASEADWERRRSMATVNPRMAHSAALGGGLVVAPLQIPPPVEDEDEQWRFRRRAGRLPVRRLHAWQKATGRLVWRHYTGNPDQPTPDGLEEVALDVSGPPLVIDDTIYVATHRPLGAIAFYLSAFDLATGTRKWSTLVCTSQIEANRHGNAYQEFAASPLAYCRSMLYGATHLGACYAMRADDGSVRWLRSYPIIPLPTDRSRRWRGPRLRSLHWANNPPAVAEGLAVFAPIDCLDAFAVDTRTGGLEWMLRHEILDIDEVRMIGFRWLLGAADGYAWFSGQGICRVPLRGGRPQVLHVDAALDPATIPRGLLTRARVYHPSPARGLVILDRADGIEESRYDRGDVGNLCSSGGVLLAVRRGWIRACFSD